MTRGELPDAVPGSPDGMSPAEAAGSSAANTWGATGAAGPGTAWVPSALVETG